MRLFFILIFIQSLSVFGQTSVSTSGNWSFTRGSVDISNAGLDFDNIVNSGVVGETTLNLEGLEKNKTWKVYVRRIDSNWHPSLVITATKNNDGTVSSANAGTTIPLSPILTAATQIVLTSTLNPFFTAIPSIECSPCSLINVKIRYQISGVSVIIPAATYQTQIEYTISDL